MTSQKTAAADSAGTVTPLVIAEPLPSNNNVDVGAVTSYAPPDASTTTASPPPLYCTIVTILVWYAISNSIILSTKWLFSNHFPFPLTVTVYSNAVTFFWALVLSRHPKLRAPRPSRAQFTSFVLPIAITTGLEIGASNLALKILTVSFGTILKGGAPIFTFWWGFLFGIEAFSLPTFGCLFMIAIGIALASLGEGQEFELGGFCLQLFATALGGLRWAMTHKLLQYDDNNDNNNNNGGTTRTASNINNDTSHSSTSQSEMSIENISAREIIGTNYEDVHLHVSPSQQPTPPFRYQAMSPLTAILYTSPMTALSVLPFALGLEGYPVWVEDVVAINDHDINSTSIDDPATISNIITNQSNETALILMAMTAIASLVFCLLMSEYWLVKATSSLALSVAGVVKELLTIGGGIFFFAEQIDWLNVAGFFTCQMGIVSYVCLRYERRKPGETYAPVVVDDDDNDTLQQPEQFTDEILSENISNDRGSEVELHQFTID